MAIEKVWCPFCHIGHMCENDNGKILCPVKNRFFTIEESNADIARLR